MQVPFAYANRAGVAKVTQEIGEGAMPRSNTGKKKAKEEKGIIVLAESDKTTKQCARCGFKNDDSKDRRWWFVTSEGVVCGACYTKPAFPQGKSKEIPKENEDQIRAFIKARCEATKEIWQKLNHTKLGTEKRESHLTITRKIQSLGFSFIDTVRMARALAVAKLWARDWNESIKFLKKARDAAYDESKKQKRADKREFDELEKYWDKFIPEERNMMFAELALKNYKALSEWKQKRAYLAYVLNVDPKKLRDNDLDIKFTNSKKDYPRKVAARYLEYGFRQRTGKPQCGLIGEMLDVAELIGKVPKNSQKQHRILSERVRKLLE